MLEIQFSNFDDVSDSGLYINKDCGLNLTNCIFSRCKGSPYGGGLYLGKCYGQLRSICFVDCKSEYGSSMYIESNKKHNLFQISCFRCCYEKTEGDSVDLREGSYNVEYLNSTFSKSKQASVLQLAWTLESKLSYILGADTEGGIQIEFHTIQYPITLECSVLSNNTANLATICVTVGIVKCTIRKFIFFGNKNSNVVCLSSITNFHFEDCVYLDKGPFATDPLPSGVETQEIEIHIDGNFQKSWCALINGIEEKTEENTKKGIFLNIFSFFPFFE